MNSACSLPAAGEPSSRFFLEHARALDAIGARIAAFDACIAAALARHRAPLVQAAAKTA